MPKTSIPDITSFPQISEIQILWIIFSGEMERYYLYRADPESLEWIKGDGVTTMLSGTCRVTLRTRR